MNYIFTDEQIKFVQQINKSGRINTAQASKVKEIFRSQVDSNTNFCVTCSGVVARSFKNLNTLVERYVAESKPVENYADVVWVNPEVEATPDVAETVNEAPKKKPRKKKSKK